MIFVTLSEAEETTELPKHQIDHDTSPIDFNDAEILSGDGEEKVVDHKKAATHINDYLNGAEDTNMAGLLGVARELRSGQSMEWHTQENWTLQSTGQSRENWPDRRYGAESALRIHIQPEYGLYVHQTLQGVASMA